MRACSRSFERVSCVRHSQRRAPLPGTTSNPVPKQSGHVAAESSFLLRGIFLLVRGESSAASPLSGTANRGGVCLRLSVGIRQNLLSVFGRAGGDAVCASLSSWQKNFAPPA